MQTAIVILPVIIVLELAWIRMRLDKLTNDRI